MESRRLLCKSSLPTLRSTCSTPRPRHQNLSSHQIHTMPIQRKDRKVRLGHRQPQNMPSISGLNSHASQGTAMEPANPTSSVSPSKSKHESGDSQTLWGSTANSHKLRRSPSLVVECGIRDQSHVSQRFAMKSTDPKRSVSPPKSKHESGQTQTLRGSTTAIHQLRRSPSLVVECGARGSP